MHYNELHAASRLTARFGGAALVAILGVATAGGSQSSSPRGSDSSRQTQGQRTQPPQGPAPIEVAANPDAGFHHPYFLLLPENLQGGAPIVVATPTPQTSEDPADSISAAQRMADNAGRMIGQIGAPVLVPVIPRPPVRLPGATINLYLPALSRAALLADDPKLARIDKQVLAMIDDAQARITSKYHGMRPNKKAIFVGFSAGGHFATRMAVLHPNRILAVWAGGTGLHPILPVAELEGRKLTYPVGVADLEEFAGEPFDSEAFSQVAIFIAQGSADMNTSLPSGDGPSDSYSSEHAQLVRELLGEDALSRLEKVKQAYAAANPTAEFRVYEGAEHRITPEMAGDIIDFIRKQMSR